MAIGVQIIGKKNVLEAFNNMDVDCWAIYQYKNLLTKGEGVDMLSKFLEMISATASGAVYTIKWYEDIKDPKAIKEKTEASGSLNFRLEQSDYNEDGLLEYGARTNNWKLTEKISGLEKEIEKLKDGGGEQVPTLEEAVIGLISNPSQLVSLIATIKDIFSKPTAAAHNPGQQYRSAAVGHLQNSDTMQTDEQKLQRLQSAVTILENNDPKLIEHLEKLAMMSQDNPGKFKMLTSMLETF